MPGRRVYFVQDYEPYLYPHGSAYTLADDTYRFGFQAIALRERPDGHNTPLADSVVVRTPPYLSLRLQDLWMVKINFAAYCAKVSHSLRHFDIEPTRRTPSPARTWQTTL